MQGGAIMGLDSFNAYESFEIYLDAPMIACKLKHYAIQDGFLVFYTGQNPSVPIVCASFPLEQIKIDVEIVNDSLDQIKIYQKNYKSTYIIYAHKN